MNFEDQGGSPGYSPQPIALSGGDGSVRPNTPVLARRALRPGIPVPVFGDDVWDLAAAIFRENAAAVKLDFTTLPTPVWKTAAKEFFFARLNKRINGRKRADVHTVQREFCCLRRCARILVQDCSVQAPSEFEPHLLLPFSERLKVVTNDGKSALELAVGTLQGLYDAKEYLSTGTLPFRPWGHRAPHRVAGQRLTASSENKTPRVPEAVMHPMLRASLWYVEHRASEILQSLEPVTYRELEPTPVEDYSLTERQRDILGRFRAWASLLVAEGRSLPQGRGLTKIGRAFPVHRVNVSQVARELGIRPLALFGDERLYEILCSELCQLADQVGIEQGKILWRKTERRVLLLTTACYVIVAYLTGMRDSEVQGLRRGCLHTRLSVDGIVERYYLSGRVYKQRGPTGDGAEWVAIEPVASAVKVMERLREIRSPGSDLLFTNARARSSLGSNLVIRNLNMFRDHINEIAGGGNDLERIPDVDGEPWRFTTRHFRRTLAWYIAREPFGVVAGKIQYQQASIAIFEGYAGTSDSGFREEVEDERRLAREDDLLTAFEDWGAGMTASGPHGKALGELFESVSAQLDGFPGSVADDSQVRALLRSTARRLYVGLYNWCFFDPSTAKCLQGHPDATGPRLAMCDPTNCPNSAVLPHHIPGIRRTVAEGKRWLARKHLPVIQATSIRESVKNWERVLPPDTAVG